jgi:hypothetical protein
MRSPSSLNFEYLNQFLLNFMYIVASEPVMNGVLHKSLPSIDICIPSIIARQRLRKQVPAATNTRNGRRIAGRMCVWMRITLWLLGNKSVRRSRSNE